MRYGTVQTLLRQESALDTAQDNSMVVLHQRPSFHTIHGGRDYESWLVCLDDHIGICTLRHDLDPLSEFRCFPIPKAGRSSSTSLTLFKLEGRKELVPDLSLHGRKSCCSSTVYVYDQVFLKLGRLKNQRHGRCFDHYRLHLLT